MTTFSAIGPTEFMLLLVLPVGAYFGYWTIVIIVRAIRRLNDCHAMLSELVREKREREQPSAQPMR